MTSQLEQLLTCCICLDRFRNPKLLPCQHSVCMEPCMEGLVDYVRRQVKCPECRAEHRIPYNGVQGYPTNVTLQRFLEAHIEITGEQPDPYTGQVMERCAVCNEKNYLSTCAHCDKKICTDCKSAHADILKREIGRINNQVKRAVHRLSDQLSIVERNISALKHNSDSVTEEIDNITKRLVKAIRDRGDFLRNEVINYYNTEQRNLTLLKEGLDQEISNVESNVDLAEKHMDDQTPWDDCELMDTKDIFLRTMEFIRSFDYEAGDYNRRAKFNVPDDLNKIAASLSTLGELIINNPKQTIDSYGMGGGSSLPTGLMKSKSDHRLAAQFRDQEDGYGYGSGRTSPLPGRRRFGERPHAHEDSGYDSQSEVGRRRFRSRFMRREEEEDRVMRYDEEPTKPPRPKVIDTEDVSRGPLSGILRLYDSSRVIQRIQEKDTIATKKKEEPPPLPKPQVTQSSFKPNPPAVLQRKTSRQASNEDEIDKIKKQNKNDATPVVATVTTQPKPTLERLTSIKDNERSVRCERGSASPRSATHSPSNEEESPLSSRARDNRFDFNNTSTSSTTTRKTSVDNNVSSPKTYNTYSRSSSTSSVGEGSKSTKPLDTYERRTSRSNSTDSNKSIDGATSPKKSTGAAFSTDELRNRFQRQDSKSSTSHHTRSGASGASRYQSRFLARPGTPSVETSKESGNEDDDQEDESSEESDSEESEETSEEDDEKDETPLYTRSDVGGFLGRSTRDAHRKDTSYSSGNATDSGYGSSSNTRYTASADTTPRRPSYLDTSSSRQLTKDKEDDFETKYPYASKFLNRQKATGSVEEETKSPFQSRFLNKSKSSAVLGPDSPINDDDSHLPSTTTGSSSRAKFEELKERRQRLARSKSSIGGIEDDETPSTTSETTPRTRYGRDTDTSSNATAGSSSRYAGTSSTLGSTTEDSNASSNQLSNWARYLKNKYGNKTSTSGVVSPTGSTTTGVGASSSTAAPSASSSLLSSSKSTPSSRAIARSRSSHLLGFGKETDSSEDDSKNVCATPTSQAVGTLGPTPFGSIHRSQYMHKEKLLFKIGSRGSDTGNFTWPRGIAIGQDDSIIVADSSNHRVQVFDKEGTFLKTFGCYGSGDGEFDCLSGVAVNKLGQYIIADRYNHRIQIFEPSGTFLRAFGGQGIGDGKFSYPWGVTTDSLGFIYVCDKENHRIQVFQSDGTFAGKFGTMGNKVGQLEHPHYIAVTSANRIIVSDSNNHRIQIFDVNGKLISTFGSEGSEQGHFKFPRGVAADEQGYVFVADSGNNRIEIFHPDGTFLRSFGCWGSGDGEFKGLEGVGVMSNGNVLICDRENHRVQVF